MKRNVLNISAMVYLPQHIFGVAGVSVPFHGVGALRRGHAMLDSQSTGFSGICLMIIVLIGPMKVGKSTVGRLLAARLGLPRHPLDKNRWKYYREIGFDEEHARSLAERGSFDAAMSYCKPFEVYAVERHLAESEDCVADFGAGYSVQDDPILHERVRRALDPHPHVVLLLPCPDVDQSVVCLNDRVDENLRTLNEHYLRHPANQLLAKEVVYTLGKTPEETCADILATLGITLP
jgi:hypothetical protein